MKARASVFRNQSGFISATAAISSSFQSETLDITSGRFKLYYRYELEVALNCHPASILYMHEELGIHDKQTNTDSPVTLRNTGLTKTRLCCTQPRWNFDSWFYNAEHCVARSHNRSNWWKFCHLDARLRIFQLEHCHLHWRTWVLLECRNSRVTVVPSLQFPNNEQNYRIRNRIVAIFSLKNSHENI